MDLPFEVPPGVTLETDVTTAAWIDERLLSINRQVHDVAGQVEAVGDEVTGFRPGDEVFGVGVGTFAEYATARPDKLAPKPANLSFEEAATVPTTGCTALQGLRDVGQVRAGQKALIIGAAGGVGSFAVQIAKAFGAHVTGVCSTSKVELVRSIGADDVIDYTREEIADGTVATTSSSTPRATARSRTFGRL